MNSPTATPPLRASNPQVVKDLLEARFALETASVWLARFQAVALSAAG